MNWPKRTVLLLMLAFFGAFLIFPVALTLYQGLSPKILFEVFKNRIYVEGFALSIGIAIVTTAIVFLIATPLAVLNSKFDFPCKKIFASMILLPMILPPFVGAIGFQHLLGHYGVINTMLSSLGLPRFDWLSGGGRFWAVCLIEALHLYPILYLNLSAALANMDPAMDEAARNLGTGSGRRFFRITLPLIKPGILAGGSIVLIWSFTELGTPLMLGYNRVASVQIFNGITELESNPIPYSLVAVMLAISSVLYLISKFAVGDSPSASAAKGMSVVSPRRLAGWSSILAFAFTAAILFLSILPHLCLAVSAFSKDWCGSILPESFSLEHFRHALSDPIVVPSIVNSLKYSSIAMCVAVLIGLACALLIVRWRSPFSPFLDALAMLPLAIPGIVLAFGYLSISVRFEWAKTFFNPVNDPTILLAVAYAVRRVPYVVRSACAGLQQTPQELEDAARNLGAAPLRVLMKVTVPLIFANLIVGALFAFSFSMLEVSDSLILAQKTEFYPITKAIFELSQILGEGPYLASAFGVWAMLFLASALMAASAMLGKQMGALFRA